jgi:prepilin signal peptidase PulO-like enzyme (type II secretory pathway)
MSATPLRAQRRTSGPPVIAGLLAAALPITAVVALSMRQDPSTLEALFEVVGLALLAAIAVVDLRTRRAPNALVYPALAFAGATPLLVGWEVARDAWLGGVAAFAVFAALATLRRGALGMGDVKTGALCGFLVGLHGVFPMLALTFIGGGVIAVTLLATHRAARKDSIPLTPFLAMATACTLLGQMQWG